MRAIAVSAFVLLSAAVGAGHSEPLRKNLDTRPAATAMTTHTMTRVGVSSGSEALTIRRRPDVRRGPGP